MAFRVTASIVGPMTSSDAKYDLSPDMISMAQLDAAHKR